MNAWTKGFSIKERNTATAGRGTNFKIAYEITFHRKTIFTAKVVGRLLRAFFRRDTSATRITCHEFK